jgi:hypothetical protein
MDDLRSFYDISDNGRLECLQNCNPSDNEQKLHPSNDHKQNKNESMDNDTTSLL